MNKWRRQSLTDVTTMLETAVNIITDVLEDEQEALDNMPENMQHGDRYASMENAVDNLEEALDKINEAKDNVEEAMQ